MEKSDDSNVRASYFNWSLDSQFFLTIWHELDGKWMLDPNKSNAFFLFSKSEYLQSEFDYQKLKTNKFFDRKGS